MKFCLSLYGDMEKINKKNYGLDVRGIKKENLKCECCKRGIKGEWSKKCEGFLKIFQFDL